MCILALYLQAFEDFPLVIAANRDEFYSRPSAPPQVLLENPRVFCGKDLLAGGTWFGVNEHGLLAGILNRRSNRTMDPSAVRSRGLLCLDILRARDPEEAREFIKREKASAYLPFNLLFANPEEAYVAYNLEDEIPCVKLGRGVHVFGNISIYGSPSEKMDHAYRLFSRARSQSADPTAGDAASNRGSAVRNPAALVRRFQEILRDHSFGKESDNPKDAICVHTSDYGTVSSTIVFHEAERKRFDYYHAPGPPCRSAYEKLPALEVL